MLKLKAELSQGKPDALAKVFHRIQLVCAIIYADPEQVHVIGHEAKNGTSDRITKRCVSQQLPELVVERRNQPAGPTILNRQCPMHVTLTSIVFTFQSWKLIVATVELAHDGISLVATFART